MHCGRRVINTQDIRLCRRTLRDAAARGRSPEKTLAMWDRVLDGETRYIKGFKDHGRLFAGYLLYLRAGPDLQAAGRGAPSVHAGRPQCGAVGTRRPAAFEHVAPLELELLPEDSMLREFYGGAADRRAQNADV